jgi:hypothetical protein
MTKNREQFTIIDDAGVSFDHDLRAWLDKLAADLENAGNDREPKPSTAKSANRATVSRMRLLDAANIIRRVARIETLADLFSNWPIGNRRTRRFWMVVDALDAGESNLSAVAERWDVEIDCVQSAIDEIGQAVARIAWLPLSDDTRSEIRSLPKLFGVHHSGRTA